MYKKLEKCLKSIRKKTDFKPEKAVILGSGLGDYAEKIQIEKIVKYTDIEDFPVSTVQGHKGQFVFGYVKDVPVVLMQGRVHYYEGYPMQDVVLPTRLMGMMGAKKILLTNAAGGVNPSFRPGDLTVDGKTINHIWDGNKQIVVDMDDSDWYSAEVYVRGTNLLAKFSKQSGNVKTDYQYYTQNAHGDIVNLTDETGAVAKSYTYDAFGVEINPDTGDVNVFRFCGEYFDTETGTIYLRARYYQASIGRFISRDSYAGKNTDPLSLNLYTYCYSNPIIYMDPSGHVIILSGTEHEKNDILQNLQELTDHNLGYDDSGNIIIMPTVYNEVKYTKGNELLSRMIGSTHAVTIETVHGTTGNSYLVNNSNDAADENIGSGGTVKFNPNPTKDVLIKTVDPNTGNVTAKKRPEYIGLVHELIHADRSMRGRNLRLNKGYYIYQVSASSHHFWGDVVTKGMKRQNVYQEELATSGLKYFKKGDITENDIRREHGLNLRGAY